MDVADFSWMIVLPYDNPSMVALAAMKSDGFT